MKDKLECRGHGQRRTKFCFQMIALLLAATNGSLQNLLEFSHHGIFQQALVDYQRLIVCWVLIIVVRIIIIPECHVGCDNDTFIAPVVAGARAYAPTQIE